jgi:phosphatidylglycerophosphate synthase
MSEAAGPAAAACFVLAVASDLVDGRLARRLGSASALGRLLDHGADCVFVASGLLGAASREAVPIWLPLLVALAFVQYVADSMLIEARGELRMSPLGRWNGILYFVPLAGDILVALGAAFLALAVRALAWGLVFTTLLSMAERARLLLRSHRRAPDSRAGESTGRSPH